MNQMNFRRLLALTLFLSSIDTGSAQVIVLDANEDIVSKKALFTKAWNDEYKGIVEYRPYHVLTGVDAATMTAKFETADDVKATVLNVIPPQRAGDSTKTVCASMAPFYPALCGRRADFRRAQSRSFGAGQQLRIRSAGIPACRACASAKSA